MFSFLHKVFFWIGRKIALGTVIFVLCLAAGAAWLFVHDDMQIEKRRENIESNLTAQKESLIAERATVVQQIGDAQAELNSQQDRVARADRIIATLQSMESTWEKLFGNREQQRMNAQQRETMEKLRVDSLEKIRELKKELQRSTWVKDGMELTISRLNDDIETLRQSESPALLYAIAAWKKFKWAIWGIMALFFFGPGCWRLFLYFGMAPRVVRGKPIRLSPHAAIQPQLGGSGKTIEIGLWPGEVLRVRSRFVQTIGPGIAAEKRLMFDWRMPLACFAGGVGGVQKLRNTRAGGESEVLLKNDDAEGAELAMVHVPEGASLVLRPRYLGGMIHHGGQRRIIRRRWQLFRWQSWVTLQFRFFEFAGPCRLIVACEQSLQAEHLRYDESELKPMRRTRAELAVGFTSTMEYSPIRTEKFWRYYVGTQPLYDGLFSGYGLCLLRTGAKTASRGSVRRFVSELLRAAGI